MAISIYIKFWEHLLGAGLGVQRGGAFTLCSWGASRIGTITCIPGEEGCTDARIEKGRQPQDCLSGERGKNWRERRKSIAGR